MKNEIHEFITQIFLDTNLCNFLGIFLDRTSAVWGNISPCELKPGIINPDVLNIQFLSSDGGHKSILCFPCRL